MKTNFSGILTLILAFVVHISFAQEKTISGTVSDNSGLPLPGATVLVKGTATGTSTDFDGRYSITASQGQSLVFSFVGYTTQEITVGSSNTINITMREDSQSLEEIVIIGYGEQSKKKLVQSIAVIDNENIENLNATNPQEVLQGQAAGVQVVQASGVIGATPVVKIRGNASITAGGQPLYVVDGVPLNDSDVGSNLGAVQGINPLADINPDDIESISVLKDAGAAAIYGSRGANGVILIKTKQGSKNGRTVVTLDVNTGFTKATDVMEMMNADQFREARVRAGAVASVNDLPQTEFDWINAIQRTGINRNINVSVTGGDDKTTFFIGTTLTDQEGFILGNDLKKISGRVNLTHQAKDWLKVGMNLGVTNNVIDRVYSENSTFAPFTSAFLQRPYVVPFDDNGDFVNTGFIANVLAIEALDIIDNRTTRTTGNTFAEVSLIDGLTFRTDFGIDRILLEEQERSFEVNSPGGYAWNFYAQQNKWLSTNTLNYAKTFNDIHDVNVLVGSSYERTSRRTISVEGINFASDALLNVVSASEPTTTASDGTNNALFSIFGRATYSYNGKYTVEGTLRRDGSSKFGSNNRYGTFYSIAAGWTISDEDFMQNANFINNLRLRASYGTSGNDRIGNFDALGLFGSGVAPSYNGAPGSNETRLENADLQWETSTSYDINLSGSLFNNRVSFSIDYYNKDTEDLILDVPLPYEVGGPNIVTRNVGSMVNKGWDVELEGVIINNDNFRWVSSLNLGINKNEITSLPGQNDDYLGDPFILGSSAQRAVEGRSVSEFFLIRYVGVNPDTGDAEWLNRDGNVTTSPTADDRVYVGSSNPDFIGGWRNTLKYKNFDLNFFFNFSIGNKVLYDGMRFSDNPNNSFNKSTRLLSFWENPGDVAYVPSNTSSTFATFAQRSTAQLRDGSFARLRNVTLGYNIPSKVLDKINIFNGVRIYATATNLLTIKKDGLEGLDPELSDVSTNLGQGETFFGAPQAKSYTLGVKLKF